MKSYLYVRFISALLIGGFVFLLSAACFANSYDDPAVSGTHQDEAADPYYEQTEADSNPSNQMREGESEVIDEDSRMNEYSQPNETYPPDEYKEMSETEQQGFEPPEEQRLTPNAHQNTGDGDYNEDDQNQS